MPAVPVAAAAAAIAASSVAISVHPADRHIKIYYIPDLLYCDARAPRGKAPPLMALPALLAADDAALVSATFFSAELFEPEAAARAFARALAERLTASKHTVAFTGAGVSGPLKEGRAGAAAATLSATW